MTDAVAWIALAVSVVALAIAGLEFWTNRRRLHRDLEPELAWKWGGTTEQPLLVLTLIREATSHRDEVASAWLPNGFFLDGAGDDVGDSTVRDDPWPQGYNWVLPPLRVIPEPTKGDTFSVVVMFRVKGWPPWQTTLQVDAPPRAPQVWAL